MALRDLFKVSRKTFFNPSAWVDYGAIKEQNRTIYSSIRNLFRPAQADREETFEQALTRLNLTENDIAETHKAYRRYAVLFFFITLLVFIYSFFLLFRYGAIFDFLIGLSVTALLAVQAFRYDFWALQIRKRTLGLTFQDWKKEILGEKEKSE